MPNRDIQRKSMKFVCSGINLHAPVDLIRDDQYAILQNVRAYVEGVLESRPGLTALATGLAAPVHSIRRLNDPTTSTNTNVVGGGANLYYNNNTLVPNSSGGFSGNPLSMIPVRPSDGAAPWMYIADSNKMRKVPVTGADQAWGIAPLNSAPTASLGIQSYKIVSDFNATTESAVAWVAGGTAGAITTPDRFAAVAITYVLYDTGSTGWASVVPAAFSAEIQPGALFTTAVTTAETTRIDSVYNPVFDTTIGSITYDSGTTGPCTVQLVTPTVGLVRDCVVRFAGGTAETVRVLSVTYGANGIPSFRCSTVNTHAAAEAVNGLRSFRAYFANTHNNTTTFSSKVFQTVTTGAGIATLSHTVARDLSNTGTRAIMGDDDIHISIKISDLTKFTEGKIFFDIDSTTNDFMHNAYFHAFRANDLTPVVAGTESNLTIQQRIQQRRSILALPISPSIYTPGHSNVFSHIQGGRDVFNNDAQAPILYGSDPNIADPNVLDPPDPNQTATGNNQWTELIVKVRDLQRIGTDTSRSLRDCLAIEVWFNCTDAVTIQVDSWWIGGTYNLDVADEDPPYLYATRPRATTTGVVGNPSPPTRFGVRPQRQSVTLVTVQHTDAQVDVIDWFRTGGSLLAWYYIGTSNNTATPTFTDELSDAEVVQNPTLEFDNFQPFPIIDIARTGTCNVSGTKVTRVSGSSFNTAWARGSIIIINKVAYTLYNSPTSTSALELEQSGGTQSAVDFQLPNPTLLAQPIPSVWGPYGLGFTGVILFGCKASTLYWTKGNAPDSAPDVNSIEVTSGSETLVNGCIYDGRPYVFSDTRQFNILAVPTDVGGIAFQVNEVANSKGLAARNGITVGDLIYFVGKDGIYATEGSAQPVSITDDSLYPLFPHDGQPGLTLGGFQPPDYSQASKFKLSYVDKLVYFDYVDTGGNSRTFVYDTRTKGWFYDDYAPDVTVHYNLEAAETHTTIAGSSDGKLYTMTGTTDDGTGIACIVQTKSFDAGDSRADKRFREVMFDTDGTGNPVVAVSMGYNNASTLVSSGSVTTTLSRARTVLDLGTADGVTSNNIAAYLTWTGQVRLYEWQPSWLVDPETTKLRVSDWQDGGYQGAKWLQGIRLHTDTSSVDRTIQVKGDNDALIATLTVNSNGKTVQPYSWPPVITHLMRLVPTDSNSWKEFSRDWVYEPEPELTTTWTTQPTTHDLDGFQHVKDGFIALRSTAAVTLTITIDGTAYNYSIPSTGGAQRKVYLIFQAVKGKSFEYSLTSSAGFRLYKKDCEIHVKAWEEKPGVYRRGYETVNPFGDISRASGATI